MCKKNKIRDFIITVGGYCKTRLDNHILYLECDDSYEGLSDKIHKLFRFVSKQFPNFDYYAKLDRYINIIKPFDVTKLNKDYSGNCVKVKDGYDGNRWWHKNKCSNDSEWNNKPYPGKFIPWCRGGSGYFLSNRATQIISCNPPDPSYHIYEDLYIAETLLKFQIKASNIFNLQNYLIDSDEEKYSVGHD
jgi:hypothetical protein